MKGQFSIFEKKATLTSSALHDLIYRSARAEVAPYLKEIEALILSKPDYLLSTNVDADGRTPFHLAAETRELYILALLVDLLKRLKKLQTLSSFSKQDQPSKQLSEVETLESILNKLDKNNRTVVGILLSYTTETFKDQKDQRDLIFHLLQHGAKINLGKEISLITTCWQSRSSAIKEAAYAVIVYQLSEIEKLEEEKLSKEILGTISSKEKILFYAIENNQLFTIKKLINDDLTLLETFLEDKNNLKRTPLHAIILNLPGRIGNTKILEFIINEILNLPKEKIKKILNLKDTKDKTPLDDLIAIDTDQLHLEMIITLIANGAQLNFDQLTATMADRAHSQTWKNYFKTIIKMAAFFQFESFEKVYKVTKNEIIIEIYQEFDKQKTQEKKSLLHIAIADDVSAPIPCLLKKEKESLFQCDNQGDTPLHLAAKLQKYNLLHYFLSFMKESLKKEDEGKKILSIRNKGDFTVLDILLAEIPYKKLALSKRELTKHAQEMLQRNEFDEFEKTLDMDVLNEAVNILEGRILLTSEKNAKVWENILEELQKDSGDTNLNERVIKLICSWSEEEIPRKLKSDFTKWQETNEEIDKERASLDKLKQPLLQNIKFQNNLKELILTFLYQGGVVTLTKLTLPQLNFFAEKTFYTDLLKSIICGQFDEFKKYMDQFPHAKENEQMEFAKLYKTFDSLTDEQNRNIFHLLIAAQLGDLNALKYTLKKNEGLYIQFLYYLASRQKYEILFLALNLFVGKKEKTLALLRQKEIGGETAKGNFLETVLFYCLPADSNSLKQLVDLQKVIGLCLQLGCQTELNIDGLQRLERTVELGLKKLVKEILLEQSSERSLIITHGKTIVDAAKENKLTHLIQVFKEMNLPSEEELLDRIQVFLDKEMGKDSYVIDLYKFKNFLSNKIISFAELKRSTDEFVSKKEVVTDNKTSLPSSPSWKFWASNNPSSTPVKEEKENEGKELIASQSGTINSQ